MLITEFNKDFVVVESEPVGSRQDFAEVIPSGGQGIILCGGLSCRIDFNEVDDGDHVVAGVSAGLALHC